MRCLFAVPGFFIQTRDSFLLFSSLFQTLPPLLSCFLRILTTFLARVQDLSHPQHFSSSGPAGKQSAGGLSVEDSPRPCHSSPGTRLPGNSSLKGFILSKQEIVSSCPALFFLPCPYPQISRHPLALGPGKCSTVGDACQNVMSRNRTLFPFFWPLVWGQRQTKIRRGVWTVLPTHPWPERAWLTAWIPLNPQSFSLFIPPQGSKFSQS